MPNIFNFYLEKTKNSCVNKFQNQQQIHQNRIEKEQKLKTERIYKYETNKKR